MTRKEKIWLAGGLTVIVILIVFVTEALGANCGPRANPDPNYFDQPLGCPPIFPVIPRRPYSAFDQLNPPGKLAPFMAPEERKQWQTFPPIEPPLEWGI